MRNIVRTWTLADHTDKFEGTLAYRRYHDVMRQFALFYDVPLPRVVAAFVALSPNSDYHGNLRSLASCLVGLKEGRDDRVVSTYGHCRDRAMRFLKGEADFLEVTKGPKTRAFYDNIVDPLGSDAVTVDGHMYYVWSGKNGVMKDVRMTTRIYQEVELDIQLFADAVELRPHQVQATLWFTRKRLQNVLYDPQTALFAEPNDAWRTVVNVAEVLPYPDPEPEEEKPELPDNQIAMEW
jgi:hypothetical protein